MSAVSEISMAIRRLPAGERWDLLHEFAEELWAEWDTRIEADIENGGFEEFINQARADISASRIRPLDEVIRNA